MNINKTIPIPLNPKQISLECPTFRMITFKTLKNVIKIIFYAYQFDNIPKLYQNENFHRKKDNFKR